MKTFEQLKTVLKKSLSELEKLDEEPWTQTKHALGGKYALWEKEIGRLCYEAEESLDAHDLTSLKLILRVDERQWSSYKSRFIHNPPERD